MLDAAPLARVVDVEQRRRRGDVSEGGHERANALPPLRGAVGDEIGPWIAGPHDQRAAAAASEKAAHRGAEIARADEIAALAQWSFIPGVERVERIPALDRNRQL